MSAVPVARGGSQRRELWELSRRSGRVIADQSMFQKFPMAGTFGTSAKGNHRYSERREAVAVPRFPYIGNRNRNFCNSAGQSVIDRRQVPKSSRGRELLPANTGWPVGR